MGTKDDPDWLETRFVLAKTLDDKSYQRDFPLDRWDSGLDAYFVDPIAVALEAGQIFGSCEDMDGPDLVTGGAQVTFTYEGGSITYRISDAQGRQQSGGPDLRGLIHATVTIIAPELLSMEAHHFWKAMIRPPRQAGRHIVECTYGMHGVMIEYVRNGRRLQERSALNALEFSLGTIAVQTASGFEERPFYK